MKKHVESVYKGKTFKCEICPSKFTTIANLKNIFKSIHEGKTFKCYILLSNFTDKSNLNEYAESVPEGRHSNVKFVHQNLQKRVA